MDLVERLQKEFNDLFMQYSERAKRMPEELEERLKETAQRYIETAKDIKELHTVLDKDIIFSKTVDDIKENDTISIRYDFMESVAVDIRGFRIANIPYEDGMKVKIIIYKE